MTEFTKLKGRTLWYDGDVSCSPSSLMKWVGKIPTEKLHVTEINKDVKQYNALVDEAEQIKVKQKVTPLNFDWVLPEKYQNLNVKEYVLNQLYCFDLSDDDIDERAQRVLDEMKLFRQHGYMHVLRCLIYIVETLEQNDQVWGVGRGSSVSSYVLYLIGVHEIDSVKYKLPFDDFLKHKE